jgi:hypothetical protein
MRRLAIIALAGFVFFSIIKVIGPLTGLMVLPFLQKLDPTMGKEAGELITIMVLLQITLLIIVVRKNWEGAKAILAGLMAGLLVAPMLILSNINKAIKEIKNNTPYAITNSKNNNETISELHINGKTIIIPKNISLKLEELKKHKYE